MDMSRASRRMADTDKVAGFDVYPTQGWPMRMLLPTRIVRQIAAEEEAKLMDDFDPDDNGTIDRAAVSAGVKAAAEFQRAADIANATEKLKAADAKKLKKLTARQIQVFDQEQVSVALKKVKSGGADSKKLLVTSAEAAWNHEGKRTVPEFKSISKIASDLRSELPNFESAIDTLEEGIALASVLKPSEFRVDPILLDGAPGIGKTMFANCLAEKLGVPFLKIGAAGLQHGAQISGAASTWSNAHAGQIFNLIAENESAVAVVLLDEIDKISGSSASEYGVLPALLELMEAGSARTFKDQSMGLTFDASKLVIICTSNEKAKIDSALLSRCHVAEVSSPDKYQRHQIAMQMHKSLCVKTGKKIDADIDAFAAIAYQIEDLRLIGRLVRSAFIRAIQQKKKLSVPSFDAKTGGEVKRKMGFL